MRTPPSLRRGDEPRGGAPYRALPSPRRRLSRGRAFPRQINADVQPTYVRVEAKKNTLQLLLPCEELTDSSVAKRSQTTGHLLLTCPKLHPIVTSKAPQPARQRPQAIVDARKELADARSAQKGAHLKGAVDVRAIIKKADALPEVEKVALGPDFDDEEEVPPLQ